MLVDLREAYRVEESSGKFNFRIPIGTKKVLVDKKPGWMDGMENSFQRNGRICPYATTTFTCTDQASTGITGRRRAEL